MLKSNRTKVALSLRTILKHGAIATPVFFALSTSAFAADGLTQLPLSKVLADEQEVIAQQPESYQLVMESIQTRDNDTVEAISPNSVNNPENVKRIEAILSEEDWNYLFAERDPAYTYLNFLKAAGKYPALCGSYSDGRDSEAICRKTLATMFAHFTQETGGHNAYSEIPQWRQGLVYLREIGWTEEASGGYGVCDTNTWQGEAYPCGSNPDGTNKSYFGRGSKQLSYNYNYGPFSQSIYGNVEKLLNEPELVADTWLNLASAVFFYLYPQPPKPSMLHVIDGTWQPNEHDRASGLVSGFGVTTQIINGGVECGGSSEHAQSQNRIDYYREFANYLDVPIAPDEVLGCKGMKQFDEAGAGALNIFWEEDWNWDASTPDGRTYKCQLVAYQGPYSSFIEGDYTKCVEDKFGVDVYDDLGGNVPPTANAGADQTIDATNPLTIHLSADGSSDDHEIVSYQWRQIDSTGINLNITSPNTSNTDVAVPAVSQDRIFTLELTVTDAQGASAKDSVNIVAKVQTENQPPVVTLMAPQQVDEGDTNVIVSANINDADDDVFDLQWRVSNEVEFTTAADGRSIQLNAPQVDYDTSVTATLQVIDSAQNEVTASTTLLILDVSGGGTGEGECAMTDPNASQYPAYNPTTVYTETSDPVSHQGLVYQAKWWVQGSEPSPSNEAWALLSDAELPWDVDIAYNGGEQVNYGDSRWEAQWWTQGEQPGYATVWQNIGPATCQ
ncbi:chitinase [Vibrio navarrensis]|uniref:chitinase n=1 Tax=Vibrio navarrensis TaxID=29495 RepID=UPI001D036DA3|nr:chitinase [Vibrio navarrensis]